MTAISLLHSNGQSHQDDSLPTVVSSWALCHDDNWCHIDLVLSVHWPRCVGVWLWPWTWCTTNLLSEQRAFCSTVVIHGMVLGPVILNIRGKYLIDMKEFKVKRQLLVLLLQLVNWCKIDACIAWVITTKTNLHCCKRASSTWVIGVTSEVLNLVVVGWFIPKQPCS